MHQKSIWWAQAVLTASSTIPHLETETEMERTEKRGRKPSLWEIPDQPQIWDEWKNRAGKWPPL